MSGEDLQSQLSFSRRDPEMWLGVDAGPGMTVSTWFAGVIALVLTVLIFIGAFMLPDVQIRSTLLDRGPTQYVSVYLAVWCVVILLMKRKKLKLQRLALAQPVVPTEHDFVLSSQTADRVIHNIQSSVEDPERFILFNRILLAISNLKNLGRVSDLDDVLRSLGERDESVHATSFATLGGFLWAIPVLGFIGTVLGLATAIGNFSLLLDDSAEIEAIVGSLKSVTGGLSTAFETTLLSLVLALVVQLWVTAQRKAEEVFLDECDDYCLRRIVSRIRIVPLSADEPSTPLPAGRV